MLLLKNCSISDWDGTSLNAGNADFIDDVKTDDAIKVENWYNSASLVEHLKDITALSGGQRLSNGAQN